MSLIAGVGVELMHNLIHLLKSRQMVDTGPLSEVLEPPLFLILLSHWGEGQGTGWSSVCNSWDIGVTQILLGRAWKQGIFGF